MGAGVYLDDVEADIADLQTDLSHKLRAEIVTTVLMTGGLILLFLLLFRFVNRRLLNDFDLFITFFNQAVHNDKEIDRNQLRFEEMYQMAGNANKMLRDKKAAQYRLLEEKEQLDVTLRSIGDAVITTDLAGRVVLMNFVAEELTGWDEGDAMGKLLSEIFNIINDSSREPVENPVEKVLETGNVVALANHTLLISKNGVEYNIEDSAAPIRDADSKINGVVLVFRDVTEQIKNEQELLKSEKLESLGVLAGGIAHDFNNLLTGLFGNIEIAKMFLSTDHKSYKFLESAGQSMASATSLSRQLLTFAKGGDPIKKTLSIDAVIIETAEFCLRGSNAKLQTDINPDLWSIEADKGQLSQVISNLVINAEQAVPEGAEKSIISIAAGNIENSEGRRYVQITVKDEGIGIAPGNINRIFDPYFSTKQEGSGLGLASCHSIISQHNGTITVDSQLNRGTIFTIRLPASEKTEAVRKTEAATKTELAAKTEIVVKAETAAKVEAEIKAETEIKAKTETKAETETDIKIDTTVTEKALKESVIEPVFSGHVLVPAHILILDDEEMILEITGIMLERMGHKVSYAVDGREAVEKYRISCEKGAAYDIVITDLTIPGGMGGREAAEEILKIDPQAKIIVSSGYSTDPVMANYEAYGFKGVAVKPYGFDELQQVVEQLLR